MGTGESMLVSRPVIDCVYTAPARTTQVPPVPKQKKREGGNGSGKSSVKGVGESMLVSRPVNDCVYTAPARTTQVPPTPARCPIPGVSLAIRHHPSEAKGAQKKRGGRVGEVRVERMRALLLRGGERRGGEEGGGE